MANKIFEVAFRISGQLSGAFESALRSAQASLRGLGAAARSTNAAMAGSLGALQQKLAGLNNLQAAVARFKDLKRAVLETQNAFNAANQKTAQLARQYREQQQAAQQLRTKLDALKASYQAQKGSLPRADLQAMRAEIKSLTQECKAAEQAAKGIGREFESSKSRGQNLKSQLQQQQQALQQLRSQLSSGGVSTSGLAQSEARLRQEIEATTRAIERQAQVQARLQSAQANSNAASFNLSNAQSNFTGAISTAQSIAEPFKAAVDNAMTFEHAMSRVKALTQTQNIREGNLSQVQADMAKLEGQARELGATTQFTMTQAADAMGYLGMAGWKTEQIYGTMPGMLNLAAGAGTDLARTADIVSDNMTAMQVPVEKAGHFMDVYAYALTNSNVNLESLGETMKYAAPVAAAFGASLEDTAAMTMMMGNAGIKGSMAGTALRMGLLRLSGPPKKASKAMNELGISVSDATAMAMESEAELARLGVQYDKNAPPMEKMGNIINQLSTKMQGLSREEKLASIGAIFGANAASGWVNIIEQGPEVFQKYLASLKDCDGYSEQFAHTMNDDTRGAMIALESAMDAVQNSVGTALLPAVRSAAEAFTPMATAAAQWIQQNPQIIQGAAAIAAGLAGIIVSAAGVKLAFAGWGFVSAQFELVAARIASVTMALRGMTVAGAASSIASTFTSIGTAIAGAARAAMAFAFSPIGVALMALALAGLYVYNNWSTVAPVFESLASTLGGALQGAIQTISAAFQNLGVAVSNLGPAFNNIGGAIFGVLAVVLNAVVNIAATIISTFANAVATVISVFGNLGNALSALLAGDFSKAGEYLKQALVSAVEGAIATIKSLLGGVFDTFTNFFKPLEIAAQTPQALPAASGGGSFAAPAPAVDTSQAQAGVESLGNASNNAATAVESNSQAVQSVSQNMTQVGETFAQVPQAVQPLTDSMSQLAPAVQPAAEGLTQVGTATQTVNTELATAQGSLSANNAQLSASTGALSTFNGNLASTNGGLQNLASNSSNAAGQISNLGSAASAAVSAMQNAAANAASTISAAASAAAAKPAANAQGGIYNRGAFLTWFAEKSPEAAIPLDKSARAISLWQKAGQMLGILPRDTSEGYDKPASNETVSARQPKFDELGNIIGLHGLADNVISKDDDVQVTNSKKAAQLKEWQKKYPAEKTSQKKNNPVKGIFEGLKRAFDFLPQINLPNIGDYNFNPLETSNILPSQQITNAAEEVFSEKVKQSKSFQTLQAARERLNNTTESNSIFGKLPNFENVFNGGLQLPTLDDSGGGIIPSLVEKISSGSEGGNFSSPIDLQFSINIQGNANAEDVQNGITQAIPMLRDVFENQLAEYNHEKQRRSFS